MRNLVLAAVVTFAGGTAMASSIEVIHGARASNGSIVSVACTRCPLPAPKAEALLLPTLAPGTQDVSIRDIDGRRETVRTEAWLGGSPVTFVSSNPIWLPQDDAILSPGTLAAIDEEAVTASVATPDPSTVTLDNGGVVLGAISALPLRQSN